MRIGTLLSALEIRERAMIPALDSLPGEHLPPLEAPVDISRISAGARLTLAPPVASSTSDGLPCVSRRRNRRHSVGVYPRT